MEEKRCLKIGVAGLAKKRKGTEAACPRLVIDFGVVAQEKRRKGEAVPFSERSCGIEGKSSSIGAI